MTIPHSKVLWPKDVNSLFSSILMGGLKKLLEELQTTRVYLFFSALFLEIPFAMLSTADTFIHWMTSVLYTSSSSSPFSCARISNCRLYTAAGKKWWNNIPKSSFQVGRYRQPVTVWLHGMHKFLLLNIVLNTLIDVSTWWCCHTVENL